MAKLCQGQSLSVLVSCCSCGEARVAAQITAQPVLCCRLQLATVTTRAEGIVLCTAQRCWSTRVPKHELLGGAGGSAFGHGEELKGLLQSRSAMCSVLLDRSRKSKMSQNANEGLLLFPMKSFFNLH